MAESAKALTEPTCSRGTTDHGRKECRCLKYGCFSEAKLYPDSWQSCHRWHRFVCAIFKAHGHLRASISFKVYLALHKSHGDVMPWHLLLLKMALRAFTKIYNYCLRLLCYSRQYRQEGRAYAVLPLSLVLWKLMVFSPSAWTFNCRNLSKPCYWNSRWAATYLTALLILNFLLSEGVLQNKDQKQILILHVLFVVFL